MSAFAPTSDHAKTLAARAEAELATLAEKRKSLVKAERDAVAGIRGYQDGRSGALRVNPFKIKVRPGFNARDFSTAEAVEDDAELVASIKAKGVQRELKVSIDKENGTLWLDDGERRLRCVIRAINDGAPIENVPVSLSPAGMNDADLIAAQSVSNSGRRFNLLELGFNVRRLVGYGWTAEKIETDAMIPLGRQKAAIEALELSPDMQAVIRQGDASPKFVAKTIAKAGSREEGERQVREAVSTAKASGSSRAMPKHLGGASSKTERAVVVDAFKGAEVSRDDADGTVSVKFSAEAYESLVAKFNLRA